LQGGLILSSCNKTTGFDSDLMDSVNVDCMVCTQQTIRSDSAERLLSKFARILSKVSYENELVRAFIKKESLKQFDKNYDVLYSLVKDEFIEDLSFRDILIAKSSESEMEEIEANLPLLNILVPEIALFDLYPKDLDVTDREIPIAVSKKTTTTLFLNGKAEVDLRKGEIPDFHVFVVNENSRVIVPASTGLTKTSPKRSIIFKSSNFDGTKSNAVSSIWKRMENSSLVGLKAIRAYSYFNKDDGGLYQRGLQRDFIYYGITPEMKSGSLNHSVSEYIGFIEINPRSYFKIADQINTGSTNDDPYIKITSTTQERRPLSESELLDRLWTKGAYDFRFEIIRSTAERPQIVFIPLKPNDIWNFNLKYTRRHKTWFRHSKHTYTIDPNNFTSKRVYLDNNMVSFGKWDLSTESVYRLVQIYEDDEGIEKEETFSYESINLHSSKFNGNIKLAAGLGGTVNGAVNGGVDVNASNTVKQNRRVTIKRSENADDLGRLHIYFYDPIIEAFNSGLYKIHTYNTGHVSFGIFVK